MTTRVIGRGICPKCGMEGSVVLKEISGRVYVYIKHGRSWCYLGPLDKVELSEVLISLSTYHTFTTKFVDIASMIGGMNMNLGLVIPFTLGLILLLLAYCLSLSSHSAVLVLALTTTSVITMLLTIAIYEHRYRVRRYEILTRIYSKGLIVYSSLSILVITLTTLATIPLASPIEFRIMSKVPISKAASAVPALRGGHTYVVDYITVHTVIPLTSLMVISLLLTLLSRVVRPRKKLVMYVVISSVMSFTIVFLIPIVMTSINAVLYSHVLAHLAIAIGTLTSTTLVLTSVFTLLVEFMKKILTTSA